MAKMDIYYKQLLENITNYGFTYEDITRDVTCKQLNAAGIQIDMQEFPLLTIKKMYWKGIVTEFLWFLKGDNNIKFLRQNGVTIWDKDAYNFYCRKCIEVGAEPLDEESYFMLVDKEARFTIQGSESIIEFTPGDVGDNYSKQWRNFNGVDQIVRLFENLKARPINRRNIVTAWDPAADTALPACHWAWEILPRPLYAFERKEIYNKYTDTPMETEDNDEINKLCDEKGIAQFCFDLKWHQRSVDTFLGLPFNIASYALLGVFIETFTGMLFRTLIADLSCIHIYSNHMDAVQEIMKNDPNKHPAPSIQASDRVFRLRDELVAGDIGIAGVIDQLEVEDFQLIEYKSYPVIKAEMLAPNS